MAMFSDTSATTFGELYSIGLGSILLLVFVWHLSERCRYWQHAVKACCRKYVLNNALFIRPNGSSTITVGGAVVILTYIVGNIFACSFKVETVLKLSERAATLAMINFVPLFLGGSVSIMIDHISGVSLPSLSTVHRWIGRVCTLQALCHGMIQVSLASWRLNRVEIVLLSSAGIMLASSFLWIRRRLYETFLKIHATLAVMLNVLLWLHVVIGKDLTTISLGVSTALWVLRAVLWLYQVIYRNVGGFQNMKHSLTHVDCGTGRPSTWLLRVSPKRPWRVQHGQFVYISISNMPLSIFRRLQAHPYLIAWSENASNDQAKELCFLIEEQRGFSNRLQLCKISPEVFIDGPYGNAPALDQFDKVLFVASGVGIAAHLLSIRHLLQAHDDKVARVRRISLIWLLEDQAQEDYAIVFLEQLMQMDRRRIFTVLIYAPPKDAEIDVTTARTDGRRSRVFRISSQVEIGWLIYKEWDAEAGNMVLSFCGTPLFEKAVRKALRENPNDITLVTSPFEIDESTDSRKIAKGFLERRLPTVINSTFSA